MMKEPVVLWEQKDIAEYRGVTKGSVGLSLVRHPLPPDFVTASGKPLWLPETGKAWSDRLPARGKYQRAPKES